METSQKENEQTFLGLKKILDEKGIEYRLIEHEPAKTSEEAAKIRGTKLESGAKALLVKADKDFRLVVLSAAKTFNNKTLKKVLKVKNLRFAKMEEVLELTGCLNGAVPPFGRLFGVKTLVDKSLFLQGEFINFNAGLRSKSIIMSVADYRSLENQVVIDVCEE